MRIHNKQSFAGLLVLSALLFFTMAFATGCGPFLEAKEAPQAPDVPEVTPEAPADATAVTLYFADSQVMHVYPETRQVAVSDDETLAAVVVREMLGGPDDPHLRRTLPEDTELLGVEIVDEVVFVNLSNEVKQAAGSASEIMALQSLRYSLTDLPGISRVQVLIEGKSSESIGGHVLLDEPFGRGPIDENPIFVDEERARWLQERADSGIESFRTDPLEAARFDGRAFGFTGNEKYEVGEVNLDEGRAIVEVQPSDSNAYALELVQPAKKGDNGIWFIKSVSH